MQYLVEGGSNDDFHGSPRRFGPSRSTRHVAAHRRHRPDFQAQATNATVHSVFLIGPNQKMKVMLAHPMTTGRNLDQILRAPDSMQLPAVHEAAAPVKGKQAQNVVITGSVSDEDAKKLFPQAWKASKPDLRITTQPRRSRGHHCHVFWRSA